MGARQGAEWRKQAAADAIAAGLPTPDERLDIVRAAIRRGDDLEVIRARWPSVWPPGPSGDRKWNRDRRRSERRHAARCR